MEKELTDPVLEAMLAEYALGTGVYAPSLFWHQLNEINISWLKRYGFDRFKQTVNNNYFNWMVSLRSPLFCGIKQALRDRGGSVVATFFTAAQKSLKNPEYCLMTAPQKELRSLSSLQRLIYTWYLVMLNHVAQFEAKEVGILEASSLSEPLLGHPMVVSDKGRLISQDTSNSLLELVTLRKGLKAHEAEIRTVAEIGAGYGRFVYAAKKLGLGERYIIVDIPPALYISQRYLSHLFPTESIFAYRPFTSYEEIREEFERATFAFLMPHQFELLPRKSVDLIVNISSLQEMTLAQIDHYYRIISDKAKFFYTKQWVDWKNPEDGHTLRLREYHIPTEWRALYSGTPISNTMFFETLYEL